MLTKIPSSPMNEASANAIETRVIIIGRKETSDRTVERCRVLTNAAAVVNMAAIQGMCSLHSIAKACSHAVFGFESSSARG